MKKTALILFVFSFFCLLTLITRAQVSLAPLSSRAPLHPAINALKESQKLELPFFDDFSNYEGTPNPRLWTTFQAFVNKDYAPEPPSVGMATLDALDADGNLYAHASTNLFAADTLCSQIIRLDSLTGIYQQRLEPSDSIILSFFYLPGGWYGVPWELVGDTPSQQDSLFLDFYDAAEERWNTVWATPGFAPDTAGRQSHWPWRYAYVKIDDPRFLSDRFQFRFRNYASLDANPKSGIAGNCDQWNIDYIYLNRNRSVADSFSRDVAFVEKAPSMLEHYQAMPARQFRPIDMAQRLQMKMVNRYNQTLASNYSYTIYNADGQRVGGYDGGFENIPPFFPGGQYQTNAVHCQPPVNYAFPMSNLPAEYRIVHVVREGVGGDNHTSNDTVVFVQRFGNYYAYDDGVPENGYGLTAPGSRMWLAVRFDLNTEDTLTAIDLYFNRTRNSENENIPFQLCVWSSHDGAPASLLYKDDERRQPLFGGMNRYQRYILSSPLVVSDTIFVGFEQLSNGFINLGFDRSNDSRHYTYSRTTGQWSQSYLRGAVMLRPCFGSSAAVGITHTNPATVDSRPKVFPNPSNGTFTIETPASEYKPIQMHLLDMSGRTILSQTIKDTRHTIQHALTPGIYLLRLVGHDYKHDTKVIIK